MDPAWPAAWTPAAWTPVSNGCATWPLRLHQAGQARQAGQAARLEGAALRLEGPEPRGPRWPVAIPWCASRAPAASSGLRKRPGPATPWTSPPARAAWPRHVVDEQVDGQGGKA